VKTTPDLVAFCEAEFPRLVGMLGLYTGDRKIAEELAQEALVRVWRHWQKVRSLDNPAAWTRKVAINLANSHLRRMSAERRARKRLAEEETRRPFDAPEAQAIRDAVARLPRRQRSAIVLHYYLDMPFGQVADVMQIPEPTAKSLARRGILRLRDQGWTEEVWGAT
jgi:RNA polymerase sigma-70 factor (ECF subfamily)